MAEISEQNVIVTGAARGIGRAIAEKFSGAGADVGLVDLEQEAIEATISEIEASVSPAGSLSAIEADVTDADSIETALGDWMDENGTVDTLVNNAGITRDKLMMRQRKEDWDSVIDVNLTGAYNCTQAVLRSMMKNRWGRIVMLSSVIGLRGNAGQSNYSASKAGLIGLCKSIAQELGSRSITCNAVAPGFIRTKMTDELPEEQKESIKEMTPLDRFGAPEEVADCIKFLASEQASFITGEVIRIDGGMGM